MQPDVSSSNPKVLLLSQACKLGAIEVPVSNGASGFSCEKTLSGFLVIEHVCVELCLCDVVPRRRGYGKCEQHHGLAGADMVADG